MRIRMIPILLAIIIIIIPLGVLGAVAGLTATYVQEPYLQFCAGTSPYSSEHFIGLLGTMTVTVANPPVTLKQASIINLDSSAEFKFSGRRWHNGYQNSNDIGVYLDSVVYINSDPNLTQRARIDHEVVKLTNPDTVSNISSLVVKFYFVAHEVNINSFVPGDLYTLYSGTIGTFNLAVAPESTNIDDVKVYISVNGQEIPPVGSPPLPGGPSYPPTSPAIPIIGGGSTSTIPSVPYVDDEHPLQVLQYLLSIINERTIDLSDAYGSNRTNVAKARIDLVNATSGTNYKVDIKFESNSVYQGKFHLHLDGILSQYSIPYDLYFKQDIVEPGVNIRWGNIQANTANEKTIEVTGVIQDEAERAPAGTYRDTITVTITPVDTV